MPMRYNDSELGNLRGVVASDGMAHDRIKVFDGYSIGSNDLTQLVLGLDRDSGTVAHLFDERNAAVRQMIASAIEAAHGAGKPIGICGQAPSDYPDFAAWLVRQEINSISFNPIHGHQDRPRHRRRRGGASTDARSLIC
jgi:pyruvate, water dikinase